MPALVAGIHVFFAARKQDVDGRDKPGHDGEGAASAGWAKAPTGPRKARPDDKLRAVPTRSFAEATSRHARPCAGHPRLERLRK
jgi:hypothetical protein